MLGLGDVSILCALLGSLLITAICVCYGAINWNRTGDEETPKGKRQ